MKKRGKPKVTQILYSGLGGHASVAFSLLSGDSAKEWCSSLLFIGVEPVAPAYRQKTYKLGIPFESIQTRRGQPWLSWAEVYAALRQLSPDIVILHSISSLPPVALYCLVHRSLLLAVEHTSVALKTRAERIMSILAFILAKRIVVLTDSYKSSYLAVSRLIKLDRKVVVIPNGIDVSLFSRIESRPVDGMCRIGMAARFSLAKRQDLLVLALALLVQRRSDVRWELTFAGDGDCLNAVQRLAASSGVGDRVSFMGHLDEAGLIEWFHSLDMYAHASEGEALSTSMLQAMSMALPMVASSVPGITDLLDCGESQLGLLAADNTPEAFADGIQTIQVNPDLQVRLGASCRARVASNYGQEMMFRSYNNLIQECRK